MKDDVNQAALAEADALAQALLREYMHRKGFRETLATFDSECPRNDRTIRSRQRMAEMMGLSEVQRRNAAVWFRQSAEDKPFATFMEMLCSYRLRKRRIHVKSGSDEAEWSDSSIEMETAKSAAAERRRAIDERRAEIAAEAAAAKPAKHKEKKNSKDKKPKKEKKQPKPEPVVDDSVGVGGVRPRPSARTLLDTAMSALSALPTAAATVTSRAWVPPAHTEVPTVGLDGDRDVSSPTDAPPPSFVAGAGFSLKGNVTGAPKAAEWSPRAAGGSSAGGAASPDIVGLRKHRGPTRKLPFASEASPRESTGRKERRVTIIDD